MKFWRKYHKWGGIILSFFLLLFSISGIVLNHRKQVSSVDISRQYLTSSFQYDNWNNAALKGSIRLDSTQTLFYGNVGCWINTNKTNEWNDFNTGFPKGIDNRKVSKVIRTKNGRLFAGTLFGLYEYKSESWSPIKLEIEHPRISDLIEVNGKLTILTRSELGQLDLINDSVVFNILPSPEGYKNTTSLFKTIWILHSGEILGITGKILVDIIAGIFIFLIITGIIWFASPSLIKRARKKLLAAKRKKQLFRFSVKWHNKIGYYAIIFLIFTTFTGIFLRPPLLIAIANSEAKSIPFTVLDSPNAWYDQLRAIRYNRQYNVYLVSSSKGMYALTNNFEQIVKIPNQPPVSVMGINVFEEQKNNNYLIGSFSGLYLWNPFTSSCINYVTKQAHIPQVGMSRPIGVHMATGYHQLDHNEVYFDYNQGAVSLNRKSSFGTMPNKIKTASPLSIWNLALEVHTGRIFQDLIGAFYILIVPLTGITTILLLLSGLWIYWKKYKKQTSKI
ncbi:PepSY-associated TM helix domain-containing protein [Carboxylicivirga marina]|uniref:PepSY domain-containing protein n=1 Tax=Carboxylicivirga marina TaxID=2800988 RepID=A0ABS1HF74_9BACT|nr:PepSY-associated TM helix domain-containing protein [Carboxylicivirga marina]MBK3516324.1 PepSY domain-containing protein [Carboxylicivirga marina]